MHTGKPLLLALLGLVAVATSARAARTDSIAPQAAAADGRNPAHYVNTVNPEAPARKTPRGIITQSGGHLRAFSAFRPDTAAGQAWADAVNQCAQAFGPDVRTYAMPIPTAAAFYTPRAAANWVKSQEDRIRRLCARLDTTVHVVDAYSALAKHVAEPIYSRTDHHWAPLGAYYAARAFAQTAGVEFRDLTHYEADTIHRYVGTMYTFTKDAAVKADPEEFVFYKPLGVDYEATFVDYTLDKARRHVTSASQPHAGDFFRAFPDGSASAYLTFMGGDSKLVGVRTSSPGPRRLLILKDSFGNALPPFLFYGFNEVHVVDCRYFTGNITAYVREKGITDVLFANNMEHVCMQSVARNYLRYLTQSSSATPTP